MIYYSSGKEQRKNYYYLQKTSTKSTSIKFDFEFSKIEVVFLGSNTYKGTNGIAYQHTGKTTYILYHLIHHIWRKVLHAPNPVVYQTSVLKLIEG